MAETGLYQSISQTQTLAPQMRKSLEILQSNTLELSQLTRQALETNPTLEDVSEVESLDQDAPENADTLDHLNETDDEWREQSILDNRANQWSQDDEERRQRLYDNIVAPETLQQHLRKQLDLSLAPPPVHKAAVELLGCLDDRGFLETPAP